MALCVQHELLWKQVHVDKCLSTSIIVIIMISISISSVIANHSYYNDHYDEPSQDNIVLTKSKRGREREREKNLVHLILDSYLTGLNYAPLNSKSENLLDLFETPPLTKTFAKEFLLKFASVRFLFLFLLRIIGFSIIIEEPSQET